MAGDATPGTGTDALPQAPAPALSADEFSSAVSAITSAFGDPTRRRIYLYARERAVAGDVSP